MPPPRRRAGVTTSAANTNKSKQEFRLRWAKEQYETMVSKRVYSQSYNKIDVSTGTYMSLSRIIKEEGGHHDPSAVAAGIRYVTKCLQMNGPWTLWNEFTVLAEDDADNAESILVFVR